MQLIKGENLTPFQVSQVKSAYGFRWTIENLPRAKSNLDRLGFDYPTIKPVLDSQWLKEYAFYFRKDGRLSQKHSHCESACMVE